MLLWFQIYECSVFKFHRSFQVFGSSFSFLQVFSGSIRLPQVFGHPFFILQVLSAFLEDSLGFMFLQIFIDEKSKAILRWWMDSKQNRSKIYLLYFWFISFDTYMMVSFRVACLMGHTLDQSFSPPQYLEVMWQYCSLLKIISTSGFQCSLTDLQCNSEYCKNCNIQ